MIALPKGVTVHKGGREWVGEIPAELCPEDLKPAPAAVPAGNGKATPAAPAKGA